MREKGIVLFPLRVLGIKFDAVSVKCTDIFDMDYTVRKIRAWKKHVDRELLYAESIKSLNPLFPVRCVLCGISIWWIWAQTSHHIINSLLVVCYRRTVVLPVAAFDSRMRFLQELRGSFVSAILYLGGTVTTSTIAKYYIRSSRMMQPMKTFTAGLTISDASEMNIGFCQMR